MSAFPISFEPTALLRMWTRNLGRLEESLIYLAICLLLSLICFLALGKRQQDLLMSLISAPRSGRRISSSKTPPRSFSPEKKVPNNVAPLVDFKDIFPPFRREALLMAGQHHTPEEKKKLQGDDLDEAVIKEGLIGWEANYRDCGLSKYTAMGISMEEINALGDFPDYAELSGVPLPEAYEEFTIKNALPRPYRPLRWAYHQTMSLTKLEPDWWLELEKSYAGCIEDRKKLFKAHGKMVLDYLPGSELACKETMEMALQFLCARYPQYFSLTHSATKGYIFKNGILKNKTIIRNMHPLHVLLCNVPEDFAIMLRNPEDGFYYFRAGILCSALGWNVSTKLGLQLKEIHSPIPDYKEKMEFSMDRYFAKLPTSRPIQRGSWGLEIDRPLFMPPGDPHEQHRLRQDPDLPLSRIHLRVDWQTLRRVPLSGAIIFNFKALFTPIEQFRDEAYIPTLLSKICKEGKKSLMEYKNTWHVEHKAIPAFEAWDAEQRSNGLVPKDWEVRTLEQSPWFPGWEEKWHRMQGF